MLLLAAVLQGQPESKGLGRSHLMVTRQCVQSTRLNNAGRGGNVRYFHGYFIHLFLF